MRHISLLATTVSAMAIATAASAQSGRNEVEEVVVTGSRIVRDGYEAPTPVTVATAEQLRSSAPGTLADGLNQLPQFGGSLGSTQRSLGITGASHGGNYLALRNLGPNRTLIMMDQRRLPPTQFKGLVDAGIVPELLVERVDVVTGGVSAVYGSDAVAGVVNYILDRKFTGLKVNAQFGFSNYSDSGFSYVPGVTRKTDWLSDGKSYRLGAAGGMAFMDDRAHVLASFERSYQGAVRRPDRPYTLESWAFVGKPGLGNNAGTAANPYFLARNVVRNDLNFTGRIGSGPPGVIQTEVSEDGRTVRPYDPGIGTGIQNASIGGSGRPSPQLNYAITPLKTDQGFAQLAYDVTDKIRASVSGTYSHSIADVYGQGGSMANFPMFSGNPYLPATVQAAMTAANTASVTLSKRMMELNGLQGLEESKAYTVTAALEGEIVEGWKFDAYYAYGRATSDVTRPEPENKKWYAALDAVTVTAANVGASGLPIGSIQCRIRLTNPGLQPGCVPYNAFGLLNTSPEAQAYILAVTEFNALHISHDFSVSVSGSPFSTWAGPVGVSAGAEYRTLKLDVFSNADLLEPPIDYTGVRGLPATTPGRFYLTNQGETHGSTNVKELFGEVAVPLASDMPLVHRLEVSGAARRTDYQQSGAVTSWKGGLTYEPIPDLRFRAAISRDIRAPTLNELFATETSVRTLNSLDPHTNFTAPTVTFTGGNPTLKPEIGKTKTLGIVYRPEWAPGLGLSIDAFDIRIDGAIGQQTALEILNDCESNNGAGATCALIDRPLPFSNRTPANFFSGIHIRPLNLSFLRTNGVDIDLTYRFDLADVMGDLPGSIALRAVGTYTRRFTTQFTATSPIIQTAGYTETTAFGNQLKWKGVYSATYSNEGFSWKLQARHLGKLKAGPTRVYTLKGIPDWVYFDTTLERQFDVRGHEATAFVTVNNLLNKAYPIWPGTLASVGTDMPTIVEVYDVMLRYFTVGVRAKF